MHKVRRVLWQDGSLMENLELGVVADFHLPILVVNEVRILLIRVISPLSDLS